MFKHIVLPAILGTVLFSTGYVLVNADEIMRENCLETVVCYNPDRLK